MIFRKKELDNSLCFHNWRIADFGVNYSYNGIDEDAIDYFIIGCEKCGKSRKIDKYEYLRMKSNGFLKEAAE